MCIVALEIFYAKQSNKNMKKTINCNAKINLSLDVTGRRTDGYHLVEMVMQTLDLCDELTMERLDGEKGVIQLETDLEGLETDQSNLVCRAVKALMDRHDIKDGVRMHLAKRIPMAAGLAGGSADCAGALKLGNELFGLGLSDESLREIGVTLGADVPYCIMGGTALAQGIGEVLTPLAPMPDCGVLLAKPSVSIATGPVYQAIDSMSFYPHPDTKGMITALEHGDIEGICRSMMNVLEFVTGDNHPVIGQLEKQMMEHGAIGSMMSGSGPTVFGIFEDIAKAKKAGEAIRESGFEGFVSAHKPV